MSPNKFEDEGSPFLRARELTSLQKLRVLRSKYKFSAKRRQSRLLKALSDVKRCGEVLGELPVSY